MSRSTRILLAWLLAALLPLQGYAAAAMISCGPMHAHRAAQSDAQNRDHAGHLHSHAELAAHDLHASGGTPPAVPGTFDLKCSACAACCTGAAAPAPVVTSVSAVKQHLIVSFFFDWSDHSVVPPRLDRPPRAALA